MMDFTREELEGAELLLVVNKEGGFKWSSYRSDSEVAAALQNISFAIQGNAINRVIEEHREEEE